MTKNTRPLTPPYLRPRDLAFLRVLLVAVLAIWSISQAWAGGFGFADVAATAHRLATHPYDGSLPPMPAFLKGLTPDQYGEIQDQNPLWRGEGLPFEVQFYLPGSYFERPVTVNVVKDGQVERVPFSAAAFGFGKLKPPADLPETLGFAGFRLLYPLNTPPHHNEFISFLGASYFRAVGKDQEYGTSARGLAIDTALPSGEIFPYFKEFWLVKPAPGATDMTVYALLDSPVATGAYRFVIHPGDDTTVDVEATVYLRKPVGVLELAPLTSMYWHGKGRGQRAGDWHPAVHDGSDLLMANGDGEWITRPLNNPLHTQVTTYEMEQPRGFGIVQQDRRFSAYEGLNNHYELRPSVWVDLQGDWGKGHVELVELPTDNKDLDNVVAFWVPEHQPAPGKPFHFAYRLRYFLQDSQLPPSGHPVSTYVGDGKVPGSRVVVVNFAGGALGSLPADAGVEAKLTLGDGAQLLDKRVEPNPHDNGWRVTMTILPKAGVPANVRLFLTRNGQALTDTWTYLLDRAAGA